MCCTYDKSKAGATRELQSRMVPPKKLGRVTLNEDRRLNESSYIQFDSTHVKVWRLNRALERQPLVAASRHITKGKATHKTKTKIIIIKIIKCQFQFRFPKRQEH